MLLKCHDTNEHNTVIEIKRDDKRTKDRPVNKSGAAT